MDNHTHTLVISDIHIGSAISSSGAVLKLLQHTHFSRLILLGDIFDGPHVKKINPADEALLSHLEHLMNSGKEIIWVRGNHDRTPNKILSRFKNLDFVEEYRWDFGGKKYIAMHGHQFDRTSPKGSKLGAVSTHFHSAFATLVRHKKTVRALEIVHTRLKRLSTKIAKKALKYADVEGVDFIICAHTHRALHRIHKTNDNREIQYFNTGSWIQRPYSYVTVDEKGIHVKKYQEK